MPSSETLAFGWNTQNLHIIRIMWEGDFSLKSKTPTYVLLKIKCFIIKPLKTACTIAMIKLL